MNRTGVTVGGLLACGVVAGGIWAISASGGGTTPRTESVSNQTPRAAPVAPAPIESPAARSSAFEYAKLAQSVDPAQLRADFEARYKRLESEYDLDGDGELSQSEKEALWDRLRADYEAERLAKFDADGDGTLSEEEERAARLADLLKSEQGREFARQSDTNKDGVLDASEVEAMRASFDGMKERMLDRYDLNGDREMDDLEKEIAKASWQEQMEEVKRQLLPTFDKNGDGELGPMEQFAAWTALKANYDRRDFVRANDTNADGVVDAIDLQAFVDRFSGKDPAADLNGDGVFDSNDLDEFNRRIDQGENTMPTEAELPFDDWWNDKGDSGSGQTDGGQADNG